MLNIFSLLCRRKSAPTFPAPATPDATSEDDSARGCGWFDSSHELQHGLLVQERDADAVAAELPLAHWLDLHLSGCRATCPT